MTETQRARDLAILAITIGLLTPGTGLLLAQDFQVQSFGKTDCTLLEHAIVTGNSRGSLALSSSQVFYSGDFRTAHFDLDLAAGTQIIANPYDGLVSDLETGALYSLATGTTPLRLFSGTETIDTLLELDEMTGAVTGDSVALSSPIPLKATFTGIFSSYGRIVLWDYWPPGAVYDIDLPSGVVTVLPAVAKPEYPLSPRGCSLAGAFWGVAESLAGDLSLLYASFDDSIIRLDTTTSVATVANQFTDLSNICSFTVDPGADRWYFQFRTHSEFGGLDQTIAYCTAEVATAGSADLTASNGGDLQVPIGDPLSFVTEVSNEGPDDATGVVLSIEIPGILDATAATPSQGSCTPASCGTNFTCDLGDLSSGSAATVEVMTSAVIEGSTQISYLASADEIDPDLTSNSSARNVAVLTTGNRQVLALKGGAQLNQVDLVTHTVDLSDELGSVRVELPGEPLGGGHGLAVDPITGEVWAVLRTGFNIPQKLATIDPRSGMATMIGEPDAFFWDLAFDGTDTLYGLTGQPQLYEIDRTTADTTFITDLEHRDSRDALAANRDDQLLYHVAGPTLLEAVDPTAPSQTPIPLCRPLPGRFVHAATHVEGAQMMVAAERGAGRLDSGGTYRQTTSFDPLITDPQISGLALVEPPQSDLSVVLTDSADPVAAGDTFTYTALIHNDGPEAISDLGFVDELPGEVVALSATPSQGSCEITCGLVFCQLGALASSTSATVDIDVRAIVPALIENAIVYSPYADPNPSNNTATETTTITGVLPSLADGAQLYSLAGAFQELRLLAADFSTLESIPITDIEGTLFDVYGLAADPTNGQLWTLTFLDEPFEDRALVKLDPTTGVATSVGATGDAFAALAFDNDGVLYGLTGNDANARHQLFTLDLTDGTATPFLDLSDLLNGFTGEFLTFHPEDGKLYAATAEDVVAVDLAGPVATRIGPCRQFIETPSGAVSIDSTGVLIPTLRRQIYRFDVDTGVGSLLGSIDHTSLGLAFSSAGIFADGFESGDLSAWSASVP